MSLKSFGNNDSMMKDASRDINLMIDRGTKWFDRNPWAIGLFIVLSFVVTIGLGYGVYKLFVYFKNRKGKIIESLNNNSMISGMKNTLGVGTTSNNGLLSNVKNKLGNIGANVLGNISIKNSSGKVISTQLKNTNVSNISKSVGNIARTTKVKISVPKLKIGRRK